MASILAKFDGEKIEVPDELRGAAPGDVLIVYPAMDQLFEASCNNSTSFRDFFGRAGTDRTAEDIDAQIRKERDSWDEQ